MELSEALSARHSVRDFLDRDLEPEVLSRLLDAAALAPSALNEQPWKFYVATGEARVRVGAIMAQSTVYLADYIDVLGPERYEEASRWYTEFGGAPVIIAVTIPQTDDDAMLIGRMMSVGAAVENLLLAAVDEGLGACAVTFSFWVRNELENALGVDSDRSIVGLVVLGYPAGEPQAPEHSRDVAVFRE